MSHSLALHAPAAPRSLADGAASLVRALRGAWLLFGLLPDAADGAAAPIPDEELMTRASRGDRGAFGDLVRRHERWARTFAGRAIGDFDEAEDMVQAAFLNIWAGAARWRTAGSFRRYLLVALARQCADHRAKHRPMPVEELPETADTAPDAFERLCRRESVERIARLVERLPPTQRLAILLFYGEDLSQNEAAAAMNLKPKAFESLLGRARAALRSLAANAEEGSAR